MANEKIINLPDSADISHVSAFHEKLLDEIQDGDVVCFDASTVSRADTAFLQLLTAFVVDAPTRQISVSWNEVTTALKESANLLGLSGLLQLSGE